MADQLWAPKDLAGRWQCSVGTVMDRVRTRGVPYLWLGTGEPRLTGRGAKLIRFRPGAVEQWEANQEGFWDAGAARVAAAKPVQSAGLLRGQRARGTR